MKESVTVLFRGALANYKIRYSDDCSMEANLTRYSGEKKDTPRQFFFIEMNEEWNFQNAEDQALMENIYQAAHPPALSTSAAA